MHKLPWIDNAFIIIIIIIIIIIVIIIITIIIQWKKLNTST